MYKNLIIFCTAILLFQSCGRKNKAEETTSDCHFQIKGDTINIEAQSPLLKRLHLQTVNSSPYNLNYTTTGTVRVITGMMADLSVPFDGRITRSFVRLGQKVNAGAPVFEIYSPEYFESVKAFIQAKEEKQLATKNQGRLKDLLEHGVGSKKEFEEAEATLQIAGQEYEKAKASLLLFNVNPDETDKLKSLIVYSPIAGEIVGDRIIVGQYLKSDAEPVATVANLNKVWVVAQVKEKNISLINSIDSVYVVTDAYPEIPINGVVSYVGSLLDEQTRSVEVYIECRNENKILKPGMFANITFTHQDSSTLAIPSPAVLQEEGSTYVFVQAGSAQFVKRPVSVETGNGNNVVVLSGLNPGETIVSEGAVFLR